MKVLYCVDCGDIIAPHRGNLQPRWCACARHAVWWRDGVRGLLSVHDRTRTTVTRWVPCGCDDAECEGWEETGPPPGWEPAAYVLGLTNTFLHADRLRSAEDYRAAWFDLDPYYLFKQYETVVVRIRPGESSDTKWDVPPEWVSVAERG